MKINLDKYASVTIPWELDIELRNGTELHSRQPTDGEITLMTTGNKVEGEQAATLLSGLFNLTPDELTKIDPMELRSAFVGYGEYYKHWRRMSTQKMLDAVHADVTDAVNREK